MASLEWFRSTLTEDAPPDGLSPPLQALWYAGKTEFNVGELFEIFDRIGGNGTAVDGTVYAAGTSPPPEAAGPEVRDPLRAAMSHAGPVTDCWAIETRASNVIYWQTWPWKAWTRKNGLGNRVPCFCLFTCGLHACVRQGSSPWLWTVGHAICQEVEYGYNPGNKPDQPPNDPGETTRR